jgi:hypothetical protein
MSIFPAGYLNSHKDDADDAIDNFLGMFFSFFCLEASLLGYFEI